MNPDIVIVGGGPAGLSAGLESTRVGARPIVLEKLDRVGGLARTTRHGGCLYDVGPHRFFTRNEEIHNLFVEVVGEDLLRVPRLTRIFHSDTFFNYPLTPLNALFGLGILESIGIFGSYAASRVRSVAGSPAIDTFEDWVVDRFGYRLYRNFFKTYTEKVWGISCTQIGADWAGQRIKGLSLTTAVVNAVFKAKRGSIKTLVDEFVYPRLGAGQLYEKMAGRIIAAGGDVEVGHSAARVFHENGQVRAVSVRNAKGETSEIEGRYFLFSCPLTELVEMMSPEPPEEVLDACAGLRYRHHIGVNLEVEGCPFPDNWIYVHSPEVRMARIANYRNFSQDMAAGRDVSPITVEYFSFLDDDLWSAADEALIDLAVTELAKMGICPRDRVRSGFVVRSEKAYPVIELGYLDRIQIIRRWLASFRNLLPIGRSGMFKYNNQDHAMATGILAARTATGQGHYDPWLVNIDAEYHEGGEAR